MESIFNKEQTEKLIAPHRSPWKFLSGRKYLGVLGLAVFFATWELAPRLHWLNPVFVPPLSEDIRALWGLILTGNIWPHVAASLLRAFSGFILAVVISVPLGILMGRLKTIEAIFDPLLQAFRQTSALALLPVFLLIFGIGEASKMAVVFWACQWPILLSTISGVKNVDPILVKSARSMGASQMDVFKKVVIPSAVPSLITGMRLAATTSLLALIAAEMLGAKAGLGFLVFWSENTFKISQMYAAIIVLALFGLVLNYILVRLERKFSSWKDSSAAL